MYCDKENINILTALLVAHGIRRVVVCPGSRNAAIVHNLNECKDFITCYPVTDERSAGFYALGMSLSDGEPVAVCVTSGTAVLNLAPAVAEASYRHHGLIVITADRPEAWIGQLDGQTLVQPCAFGCNVGMCVSLTEPLTDEQRWHCNRLVNEALLSVRSGGRLSVQINIPISEPMFNFTISQLPIQRKIEMLPSITNTKDFYDRVLKRFVKAERPMVVVGQTLCPDSYVNECLRNISHFAVIINESLSSNLHEPFDMAVKRINGDERYLPDFIIYLGDALVSKRAKQFIRQAHQAECWTVSMDGEIHDVFMNLIGVVAGNVSRALGSIADAIDRCENKADTSAYVNLWHKQYDIVEAATEVYEPKYSQMAAVKYFFLSLEDMDYAYHVHCANSMAVRLAEIYVNDYVWCNRGVNGIEGSISTAAGFSCTTSDIVFCLTGDLSFFYDSNALWNQNLGGNLRIVLLNNGGGEIFRNLHGLTLSPAFDSMVCAKHSVSAKGLCEANDVGYISACNMDELRLGIATLLTIETNRPVLFEVFTNPDVDKEVYEDYMNSL